MGRWRSCGWIGRFSRKRVAAADRVEEGAVGGNGLGGWLDRYCKDGPPLRFLGDLACRMILHSLCNVASKGIHNDVCLQGFHQALFLIS